MAFAEKKRTRQGPHGKGRSGKSKQHSQRRVRRGGTARTDNNASGLRLQKVLAAAGIGSRRHCEELMREGRVEVDGQTVTELGTRVDPAQQKIRVDGELVRRPKHKLYFLVNKPAGVLSTSHDPSGRPRVVDLAPSHERLFTVGRLDQSSSGLILVTNDGALTDLLTHPRYGVEKTYVALVAGVPTPESLAKLQRGVHLAEGYAHAKRAMVRRKQRHSTLLEIVLDEGRNREVRRLLARIGHKVLSLRRVAMGPLRLGNMQPGESQPLRADEVEELYLAAKKRREKSGKPGQKTAGQPTERASAKPQLNQERPTIYPLIDKSLPQDAEADDDDFLPTAENEFDDGEHLPNDADADDEWSGELSSEAELAGIEATPIDLSPLGSKKSPRPKQRTVIGGESSVSHRPPARKKRRRDRQRGRGKRSRS